MCVVSNKYLVLFMIQSKCKSSTPMKKLIIYILLICLIISFALLYFEYTRYSEVNNRYIALQDEVNNSSNKLRDISDDIAKLKLEEETISNEKKFQIDQYQKWQRQNQILKDLMKRAYAFCLL